jgi:hypothetical protein
MVRTGGYGSLRRASAHWFTAYASLAFGDASLSYFASRASARQVASDHMKRACILILIKNSVIAEISAQTLCLCAVERELTFVKDRAAESPTNHDNRGRTAL